jgi:hypothetical protein
MIEKITYFGIKNAEKLVEILNSNNSDDCSYRVEIKGDYAVIACFDGKTGEMVGYL